MLSSRRDEETRKQVPTIILTPWLTTPLAILAWAAVLIVAVWLTTYIVHSLLIVTLASLIAYALSPLVNLLTRLMPRFLAIFIVYIAFLGVIGSLGYFVVNTAIHQSVQFIKYLQSLVQPGVNANPSQLLFFLHQIGVNLSQNQVSDFGNQIISQAQTLTSSVLPAIATFFSTLLDIVVIIVLSVYIMINGVRLRDWLEHHIPLRQRTRVVFVQDTVQRVAGGYIRGQITVAVIVSTVVGIVLTIFGVPFAILLTLVVFVLEFIPILGSLISGFLCVLVALSAGWPTAVGVLAAFVGIHVLDGYILSPRIVGRAVGLNPAISLIAFLIGAEIFGIWGALLAAPVAGTLQALVTAIWEEWRRAHPEEYPTKAAPMPEPAITADVTKQ